MRGAREEPPHPESQIPAKGGRATVLACPTSEFAFLSRSDSGSETRHNGKGSYTYSCAIFRLLSYKIYACYLLLATIIRSTRLGSGQLPGSVHFPLRGSPSCGTVGYSFYHTPGSVGSSWSGPNAFLRSCVFFGERHSLVPGSPPVTLSDG